MKKEPKKEKNVSLAASTSRRSASRDVSITPGDQAMTEIDTTDLQVKDEEGDYDMEMLDAIEDVLKGAEEEARRSALEGPDSIGGTSSEQTHNSGMAATLNILRQQGILSAPTADIRDREKTQLQRDAWLAEQRHRITQRDLERLQSRGGNKDQATREYENRLRDQAEARETMDAFKNYKPDVNIVYYDEYGRALTPKEAWKALSHKFHGKGSGKMKTEKRLKRIAEEQRKEAMASGDTPLNMNKAFLQRQEKAGQAHFVLSVGNKGCVSHLLPRISHSHLRFLCSAVPQAPEFLDTQPLSKGKTEKTKKKKESNKKAQAQEAESAFMTIPSGSHVVASGPSSASGSPAPKPGFSRVGSVMEQASSRDGTPGAERSKVAFGFGTKRKAEDEARGPPPAKRR